MSVQGAGTGPGPVGGGGARHRALGSAALGALGAPGSRGIRRIRKSRVTAILLALAVLAAVGTGWLLIRGEPGGAEQSEPPPPGARIGVTIDDSGNVYVGVDATALRPVPALTLSVPRRPDSRFSPEGRIGSLVADGSTVPVPGPLQTGDSVIVPLGGSTTRVQLGYTVGGTYEPSRPSTPGRGLVLLTPLQIGDFGVPYTLEVTDERILNLACTSAGQTGVGGTRSGSTWTVDALAGGEDVVAQVDLPGADAR